MVILVIDTKYGLSGDMLISALMDLGAKIEDILHKFKNYGEIEIKKFEQGIKLTTNFNKGHLDFSEARKILQETLKVIKLEPKYERIAKNILEILIEAETEVHKKISIKHKNKLHEASDILIDTILVSYGLQSLQVDEIYCLAPVYVGGGLVSFSHGVFEVPAPATRYIIDKYGIPTKKGPYDVELLTPTGAAILAAISPIYLPRPDLKKNFIIKSKGIGIGSKELPRPNILTVYLVEKREQIFKERVIELETDVDDVTPEVLGDLYEELNEALDLKIIQTIGKKNRPSFSISVLCYEEDEPKIVEKLFKLTGTLGIRRYAVERYVKPRWVSMKKIKIGGEYFFLRFKHGKPEHEDLKRIAKKVGQSVLELERKILKGEFEIVDV